MPSSAGMKVGNQNSHTLHVGVKTDAMTLENHLVISNKHMHTLQFTDFAFRFLPKRHVYIHSPKKDKHNNTHHLKQPQMLTGNRRHKETLEWSHGGILYNNENYMNCNMYCLIPFLQKSKMGELTPGVYFTKPVYLLDSDYMSMFTLQNSFMDVCTFLLCILYILKSSKYQSQHILRLVLHEGDMSNYNDYAQSKIQCKTLLDFIYLYNLITQKTRELKLLPQCSH